MTSPTTELAPLDRRAEVLVVDAHAPTRIGLGVLLRGQRWVTRCLLASTREEALALACRHRPDLAILDVSNAGPFVTSITASIHEAHPAIQIVLSSRCATRLSAQPSALGAAAFLPVGATSQDILEILRCALLSRRPVTLPASQVKAPGLTDREREILGLLCTGATNREIAAQMHLGPDSVKKHATALYRKLGVRNRTEAAQRAASLLTAA